MRVLKTFKLVTVFLSFNMSMAYAGIWDDVKDIDQLKTNSLLGLSISDKKLKEFVPEKDNDEPLADIFSLSEPRILPLKHFIEMADAGHQSFGKMRKSLVDALLMMLKKLPEDIGIAVFEGYRPLWKQKEYFDKVFIETLKRDPKPSYEVAYEEAAKLVAEFIDNDFPHGTGGAIDMTLYKINKETGEKKRLDMGQMGAIKGQNEQRKTFTENITPEQRDNRLTLLRPAGEVGLVNYAEEEWWHFSLGDCAWAFVKNKKSALYRLAQEESSEKVSDIPKNKETYFKQIKDKIDLR